MRKKVWLVALMLVGLLTVALGTTSVLAQELATTDNSTWGLMQQACVNGDYQAMAELRQQYAGGGGVAGSDTAGCGAAGGVQNSAIGGWGGMMGGGWNGGRGMMGNW